MIKVEVSPAERRTLIYALSDPRTGAVRYIGKTCMSMKRRMQAYMSAARRGGLRRRSCRWLAVLLREGAAPGCKIVEVVEPGGDWAAAEARWIEHYRRVGADLCNLTDGGDGAPGCIPSAASRAKKSATQSRPDAVRLVSAQSKARWETMRDDIIAAQNAGKTEEWRALQSEMKKAQWTQPDWRANQLAKRKKVIPDGAIPSIIARAAAGERQIAIAQSFGVTQSLISRVISGKSRKSATRDCTVTT
jgi:hypothetical protein